MHQKVIRRGQDTYDWACTEPVECGLKWGKVGTERGAKLRPKENPKFDPPPPEPKEEKKVPTPVIKPKKEDDEEPGEGEEGADEGPPEEEEPPYEPPCD